MASRPLSAGFNRVLNTILSGHDLREKDKFSAFDIDHFSASRVRAPLVSGCIGWLECRLIPEPHIQQAYDLFLGEVLAAWADPAVFSAGRWHFGGDEQRSIHYVAGGQFFATGEAFDVKG